MCGGMRALAFSFLCDLSINIEILNSNSKGANNRIILLNYTQTVCVCLCVCVLFIRRNWIKIFHSVCILKRKPNENSIIYDLKGFVSVCSLLFFRLLFEYRCRLRPNKFHLSPTRRAKMMGFMDREQMSATLSFFSKPIKITTNEQRPPDSSYYSIVDWSI